MTLVVVSFAPARRSVDLAVPAMAPGAEVVPTPELEELAEAVSAPAKPARAARKSTARKRAATESVAAAVEEAAAEVVSAAEPPPAKRAAKKAASTKKQAATTKAAATKATKRPSTRKAASAPAKQAAPRKRAAKQVAPDAAQAGGTVDDGSTRDRRRAAQAGAAQTVPELVGIRRRRCGLRRCRVTRFATWNINSLKVRQERLEQWLADVQPDVVCLQETKLADSAFPQLAFESLGYSAAHHGEGRWNGVAVLSRKGLDDVSFGFVDDDPPDAEARLMTATCDGIRIVNVYVPNGRALDADHYQYKLAWLDRLTTHLDRVAEPGVDVILAGDFNIAPADADVYDPAKFVGTTHTSEPERERLSRLLDWGLEDVFRQRYPEAVKTYSWWDYRAGDFHQGRGMRIDLVLASRSVRRRVEWIVIDRNARKGQLPSDHAPIVVDLAE